MFQLIERDFEVTEVPQERQDPVFRSPDIHIMKFVKKTFYKSETKTKLIIILDLGGCRGSVVMCTVYK